MYQNTTWFDSNYLVHVLINEVTATYLKKKRKKKNNGKISKNSAQTSRMLFVLQSYSELIQMLYILK